MTQELFRREVLAARRTSWLGAISLAQPLRLWILTAAACGAALAIALYLMFSSYTRRSTVTGQLVPAQGLATVLAPAAGVVSELHVIEGARVAAGQTLAIIVVPHIVVASGSSSFDLEDSLRGRKEGLQSTQDGQLRSISAQAAGFTAQLASAHEELTQLQAEISTHQQQIRINTATLDRMRELHQKQYVSQLELNQQESTTLDQVGAVQELQRQASATKRNILQLQQSLAELPGERKTVTASAQRDLAALAQERVQMKAPGMFLLTAPVSGVVATQIIKVGQAVQQGQPLLTVLPGDGKLEAELLVPSRAVGFIAPGDRVLLRYQAYPWQKFGHQQGQVASVSRSALSPAELGALLGNAGDTQPLYRVTVALSRQAITAYGKTETLKPGMLLDADILGETRQLAEWLFEPLYSLKGKFGNAATTT